MTRKKKIALGILGLFLVFIIASWFIVKSEFFIKKAVLPRVAASLGAEIDVETISLHPFSSIDLTRVTFKQEGKMDVKIGKIRAKYKLFSFLKKSPVVSECLIENGDITIHLPDTDPNTSNAEKPQKGSDGKSAKSTKKSSPPALDIRNIDLKNMTITVFLPGENQEKVHIENLNIHIPAIKNGEILNLKTTCGKIAASLSDGDMRTGPITLTTAVKLSAELLPESVDTELNIANVAGIYCQPLDTRLATKASFSSPTQMTIDSFSLDLSPAGEAAICSLAGTGTINPEAKDFQYILTLSSPEVINATALQQLFIVEKTGTEPEKTPEAEEKKETETEIPLPAIPAGIAAKVDIFLPGVLYKEYQVENIKIQTTLKNSVLTIPAASFTTFDTPVNVVAEWDAGKPENHQFTSDVTFGRTPAGKILATLRPSFPVVFGGGFENLSMHVTTQGMTVSHFLDNLKGESNFQISSLTVESMPSWAEQLTRGILRLFSLSRADLSFHGGQGKLAMDQGIVNVEDVFLDAALWRLNMRGGVPLEGTPDLTFIPAFRGTSARKLSDQGISLDQENEGFQAAPPLQLKGDIWNSRKALTAVPLLVMNYSAALRSGSAELKAVNDGVNILKDVIDKPDTITKEPGKILQGAFDIYKNVEKKKDEEDAAKGKKVDPPKPEEQLIDSLLKGVLGN